MHNFTSVMQRSREQRVHWNGATAYPHLEAHLLDLLEGWTPLPTDLCSLVLSFFEPKGGGSSGLSD